MIKMYPRSHTTLKYTQKILHGNEKSLSHTVSLFIFGYIMHLGQLHSSKYKRKQQSTRIVIQSFKALVEVFWDKIDHISFVA